MIKCEYCGNIYYGNETECSTCGAKLPSFAKTSYNQTSNTYKKTTYYGSSDFTKNKSTANVNKRNNSFVILFLAMLIIILTLSSLGKKSNSQSGSKREISATEIKSGILNENELLHFTQKFESDNGDTEALLKLTAHYLDLDELHNAFDLTVLFFDVQNKDDANTYIQLSQLYIDHGYYGNAAKILKDSYELTKLNTIENAYRELSVTTASTSDGVTQLLELITGKSLKYITFDDVLAIKGLTTNGNFYTYTTEPLNLVNGKPEDIYTYISGMKSASAGSPIFDLKELSIFGGLEYYSGHGHYDDFEKLSYLTSLRFLDYKFLDINGTGVQIIPYFPSLEGMALRGSFVEELRQIDKNTKLKHLYLENTEVSSLDTIEQLTDLCSLSIIRNDKIIDLNPLSSLINLKEMELRDLEAMTIPVNSTTINLEKLIISDMPLRNVDFLSNMTELKELTLLDTGDLIGMPDLSALTGLEYLDLSAPDMPGQIFYKDTSYLEVLTNLKYLHLHGNVDLNSVSKLVNLETLKLSYYKIENFSPLSSLTNLKYLTMSSHQTPTNMVDLSFLGSMTQLEYLDLENCGYSAHRPEGIFGNVNLKYLNLSGVEIVGDISGLSKLTMLESLYLNDVSFAGSFETYDDGFSTSYSSYDKSELSSYLGAVSSLTNLKVLSIAKNNVDNLDFVRGLSNLELFSFENNYVLSLEPLSSNSNLIYVNASKNPISDYAGLREKEGLSLNITTEFAPSFNDPYISMESEYYQFLISNEEY